MTVFNCRYQFLKTEQHPLNGIRNVYIRTNSFKEVFDEILTVVLNDMVIGVFSDDAKCLESTVHLASVNTFPFNFLVGHGRFAHIGHDKHWPVGFQ
jgi:hypothetical protein